MKAEIRSRRLQNAQIMAKHIVGFSISKIAKDEESSFGVAFKLEKEPEYKGIDNLLELQSC